MSLRPVLILLLCLLTIGCQLVKPIMPDLGPVMKIGANAQLTDGLLHGRVDFGGRSTQATPTDLVNSATVSFIDAGSNTVATGKTDATGAFSLSLGSHVLVPDATYMLEAVKGLNGQAPGSNSARFRTVLKWNGTGWLSCTNASLPGSIVINALTTALAIESALDPAKVQAADTIGKVNLATNPASLNGAPTYVGHADTEIAQLAADLLANLGGNFDPIASVPAVLPAITDVSPNSGPINSLVKITGTGFSPTLAGNTVTINGAAANVVLATPTALVVSVGSGATPNGAVSVTTGRGTVTGGSFTVNGGTGTAMWVDKLNPSAGRPDTVVALSGQFPTVGATPSVRFTGPGGTTVGAAVSAWTATSLTATVPLGAEPGVVTVQSQGTTTTSPVSFDVWQGELSAFNTVANPSALTMNYSALGSCDAPTVRWGNCQYVIGHDRVYMIPLLVDGGVGAIREVGKPAIPISYTQPAVVGNWLFLLSGYNQSTTVSAIQRAAINPDGTLGPFAVVGNVQVGRLQGQAYALGPMIFLLPGAPNARGIERYLVDLSTGAITYTGTNNPSIFGNTTGYMCNYAMFGIGYDIVLMGGYDINLGYHGRTCYLHINYDNTLSASVEGPSLPGAACWPGQAMVTVNGDIDMYVWGGYTGATWANIKAYRYTWKWNGTSNLTGPTAVTNTIYGAGEQIGFANRDQLYSIGGWNDTTSNHLLYNATAKPDKSTTTWSLMRGSIEGLGAGLRLRDNLWTFGGSDGTNALATTRYRALNSDGTMGAVTAGPALNTARVAGTAIAVNDNLYVIGGRTVPNGTTFVGSIERATIRPDGTLGAFFTQPQSLVIPRSHMGGVYYRGAIYLFGGSSGVALDSVERIPVNGDGTLGAPEILQVRLPEPMSGVFTPVLVGDDVHLVGYGNGVGATGRTIVARFKPDGALGSFSWGPALIEKVRSATVCRLGNYLYAIGGYTEAGYGSTFVQRAKFKPDGTLNAWQLYRPGGTDVLSNPHYYQGWPMMRDDDLYLYNPAGVASTSAGLVNAYLRASFR